MSKNLDLLARALENGRRLEAEACEGRPYGDRRGETAQFHLYGTLALVARHSELDVAFCRAVHL